MAPVNLGAPRHHGFGLHIDDCDVDLLTRLLVLPPTLGVSRPSRRWLQQQRDGVADLPDALRKPRNIAGRLSIKLSKFMDTAMPQVAILCRAHAGLHPWLIRALFKLLADELTARLDILRRYYRERQIWAADERGEERRATVKAAVGRLQAINALWTGPRRFQAIFGDQERLLASGDMKYVLVEGGCEACILAAVGARGGALANLRAVLVSRARGSRPPRLLRFVESWIEWFGDGSWALIEESDRIAEDLRWARRAVREEVERENDRGRRARKRIMMENGGRRPPKHQTSSAQPASQPPTSSNQWLPSQDGGRVCEIAPVDQEVSYGYAKAFPPTGKDAFYVEPDTGMHGRSHYYRTPEVEGGQELNRQRGENQLSYEYETCRANNKPLPPTPPSDYNQGHVQGPPPTPYSPTWAPPRSPLDARPFRDEAFSNDRPPTPDFPDGQDDGKGAAIGDWYEKNSHVSLQGAAGAQDMHPAFRRDFTVSSAVPSPLMVPSRTPTPEPETERRNGASASAGARDRVSIIRDSDTWVSVSVQTYRSNPLPPNDPFRRPPPLPQIPEAHRWSTTQAGPSAGGPPASQPFVPENPSSSVYAPEGEWGGPPSSSGGFIRHNKRDKEKDNDNDGDKMVRPSKSVVFRDPFEEGDGERSEAGWRRQPSHVSRQMPPPPLDLEWKPAPVYVSER